MRDEQGGRRWSTHSWRRRWRSWSRRGRGPVTPSCNGPAPAADTPSSSSSSYVRAALDRQLCRSVDHVIVLLCSSRARNRNWDERLMVVICCFGDLDDSFSGRQHGVRDCQSAVEQGPRFLAAAEATDFVHAHDTTPQWSNRKKISNAHTYLALSGHSVCCVCGAAGLTAAAAGRACRRGLHTVSPAPKVASLPRCAGGVALRGHFALDVDGR